MVFWHDSILLSISLMTPFAAKEHASHCADKMLVLNLDSPTLWLISNSLIRWRTFVHPSMWNFCLSVQPRVQLFTKYCTTFPEWDERPCMSVSVQTRKKKKIIGSLTVSIYKIHLMYVTICFFLYQTCAVLSPGGC